MLACDITDEAGIVRSWELVQAEAGPVNCLINNAGLALTGRSLATTSAAEFDQMVAVNLVGTMNACRVAISRMGDQGCGQI